MIMEYKETMSSRVTSRMQHLNLKSKDLIKLTKASKGTVSQWINGVTEPSARYISKLALALQVTERWLVEGGALEPLFSEVPPPIFDSSSNVFRSATINLPNKVYTTCFG